HPGSPRLPATKGTSSLAFHPAKPVLISGGKDGYLRFWRTDQDHQLTREIAAHKGGIYRILFNDDGSLCATCSRDRTIKIWNANSFEPLHRLDRVAGGHTHSVNSILWIDDLLISASDDRTLIAWPI
nr:hypothetical protein [Bacteroidota bacterium]